MSVARTFEVARLELLRNLKRPVVWVLVGLTLFLAYGMANGNVRIATGESMVGGAKAFVTSEFAVAQILCTVDFLLFTFFLAAISGLAILRDEEVQVSELLRATALRPGEYVTGKFLAAATVYVLILATHIGASIVFNHVLPPGANEELLGPFALSNYLRPSLFFALPPILLVCAFSLMVGTLWRRPVLVFVFPLALMFGSIWLWNWAPSWLPVSVDRMLMFLDPAGLRWLTQEFLTVDRGVEFYNHQSIPLDALIVTQRLVVFGLIGLCLYATARGLRARSRMKAGKHEAITAAVDETAPGCDALDATLGDLGMRTASVSFLTGLREVARVEFRAILRSPVLWLLLPLIVMMVLGNAVFALGPFETPVLLSAGHTAVRMLNWLTGMSCILLMLYTVEALHRERAVGLDPILYAAPLRTTAYLFGKVIAASFIGAFVLMTMFVVLAICTLVQGVLAFDPLPYVVVWGLLAVPTFFFFTAFTAAAFALTQNRLTAYAAAFGLLVLTLRAGFEGDLDWRTNWSLFQAVGWSDLAPFELNGAELLLNRLLVVSTGVLLTVLAVRWFPRRAFDSIRTMQRLRPKALGRAALSLLPWLIVPAATGAVLHFRIEAGFQGEAAEKAAKDYWRRNVKTWTDVEPPGLVHVDLDLRLEPDERRFETRGTYVLRNFEDEGMASFCVTRGFHWDAPAWTLDGEDVTPDDRNGLVVFDRPLAPGEDVTLGFTCAGRYPNGATKNGGGAGTFILPSGVVLHSFGPQFVPIPGYDDGVGVDEENQSDEKDWPDDFFEGRTRPAFGADRPFTYRIRIDGPEEFVLNSVGEKVSEQVTGDRRIVVWKSDFPVDIFNVVGGPLEVREGEGTAIYFHPDHHVNVDEMLEALDGARRWYSEWFRPFPWTTLKLTEFPALAGYAQGFATNITFSESIGFLAESDERRATAFLVTAHEAAHQWWGNLLTPGRGPGGNVLSEGKAHFSTILLAEQLRGEFARMEFMRTIEDRYADARSVDSERPLVKIDGSRDGDTTVMYDKGGWVFWMLMQEMGREAALAGIQDFIRRYEHGPDYPVLQDYVRVMREHAPNAEAFDAFVDQWFFDVAVPQIEVTDAAREKGDSGHYTVTCTVTNVGTGRVTFPVAAERGARFDDEGEPDEGYIRREQTVTVGAGESAAVTIDVLGEPERVVVDPDVTVLMLERKKARYDF